MIDLWIEWTTSLFLGGMIKLQMHKDLKETKDFMERDQDDFICIHPFYHFCVSVWERPPRVIQFRILMGSKNAQEMNSL